MTNRYYTPKEIRAELERRLANRTQREIARECGIHQQQISAIVCGEPMSKRVAEWLGFRKVTELYERTK